MKIFPIIFLILLSYPSLAKIEIWECYFSNGNVFDIFKLNIDIPSIYVLESQNWKKINRSIAYDKDNNTLYDEAVGDEIWDLSLKKYSWILGNSNKVYDCKVIDP